MSEVLEIEVDGEIDDDGSFDRDRSSPRWGLPLAVAVAGALLLAVLLVVVIPTVTSQRERREPTPAAPATVSAKEAALVKDAEGALAAWGRFAVSGDLRELDGWFVPDAPQHRILVEEAARLASAPPGPPAYIVRLTEPRVASVTGRRAALRGDVTWTRPGEVDQRYQWEVVLRRSADGRWALWTVTDWAYLPRGAPPRGVIP